MPTAMNSPKKTAADFAHIPGWGIDADPKNDPTYPMKIRTEDAHSGSVWERPPQQTPNRETLMSIERPSLPAVIGNSVSPSGLSGMIRRFAFKYSENRYRHWLPLILADRINMVEGIIGDLAHGHFPNIYAEKGYGALWKYDKKALITKLATTAAVTAGIVYLLLPKKGRSHSSRDYNSRDSGNYARGSKRRERM